MQLIHGKHVHEFIALIDMSRVDRMRCMMVSAGFSIPDISDMVLFTLCLLLINIAFCYHCTRPTRMSSWSWAWAKTDVKIPAIYTASTLKRHLSPTIYRKPLFAQLNMVYKNESNFNISMPVNILNRIAGSLAFSVLSKVNILFHVALLIGPVQNDE